MCRNIHQARGDPMIKFGRKQDGRTEQQVAEMEAMIAAFHRSQAVI